MLVYLIVKELLQNNKQDKKFHRKMDKGQKQVIQKEKYQV